MKIVKTPQKHGSAFHTQLTGLFKSGMHFSVIIIDGYQFKNLHIGHGCQETSFTGLADSYIKL